MTSKRGRRWGRLAEAGDYSPDSAGYANTLRHRAMDFSRAAGRAALRFAREGDGAELASLAYRVSSGLRTLSWHTESAAHSHRLIHQQEHRGMVAELVAAFPGREAEGLPRSEAEAAALLDRMAGVYTTELSGARLILIPLKGTPDDDEREDLSRFLRHGARLRAQEGEAARVLGEALCFAALLLYTLRARDAGLSGRDGLLDPELYAAAFPAPGDEARFSRLADEVVKIYDEQGADRGRTALRLARRLRAGGEAGGG